MAASVGTPPVCGARLLALSPSLSDVEELAASNTELGASSMSIEVPSALAPLAVAVFLAVVPPPPRCASPRELPPRLPRSRSTPSSARLLHASLQLWVQPRLRLRLLRARPLALLTVRAALRRLRLAPRRLLL